MLFSTKLSNPLFALTKWITIGGVALLPIALVAIVLSPKVLRVTSQCPNQVDAIIVLGGEQCVRVWEAAELHADGRAKIVIVSGSIDYALIARRLRLAGVPSGSIHLETKAKNTWENSEFTVSMLKSNSAKSAIIVTSWPHTRRALACFKHSGPELSFYSVPAGFTSGIQHPHPEEWSLVVSEYLKIIRYLFLGRIDLNDL